VNWFVIVLIGIDFVAVDFVDFVVDFGDFVVVFVEVVVFVVFIVVFIVVVDDVFGVINLVVVVVVDFVDVSVIIDVDCVVTGLQPGVCLSQLHGARHDNSSKQFSSENTE